MTTFMVWRKSDKSSFTSFIILQVIKSSAAKEKTVKLMLFCMLGAILWLLCMLNIVMRSILGRWLNPVVLFTDEPIIVELDWQW